MQTYDPVGADRRLKQEIKRLAGQIRREEKALKRMRLDRKPASAIEAQRSKLMRLKGQRGGLTTKLRHGRKHYVNAGILGFDATARRHFDGDHRAMVNWLIDAGLRAQDPIPWNGAWTKPDGRISNRLPKGWMFAGLPDQRRPPTEIDLRNHWPDGDGVVDIPW